MNAGHCSDELLIRFLDGEVSPAEADEVGAHLDRCWTCRTRCQEIDQAIAGVSRLFREADLEVSDSVERVRVPLFVAIPNPQPARIVTRSVRPALLFVAALAAAAGVGHWVVSTPRPAAPIARQPKPAPAIPLSPVEVPPIVAELGPMVKVPEAVIEPPTVLAPANLDDLELALRFQLHQTGADLRDSAIRICQSGGAVIIDGVVDDSAQLSELAEAASATGNPASVRLDVRLPGASGTATPYQGDRVEAVARREQPFQQALLAFAGSEGQLTENGNHAVDTVEKMTDLAWALRKLSQRFASVEMLRPDSRRLLETIQEDYRARIVGLGQELGAQLAFIPGTQADSTQVCTTTDTPGQVFALRDLIEWLFAGKDVSAPPSSVEEAAKTIATRIHCLIGSVQQVQGE